MMESRLGPDKCLKRWCRICGKEMELEYDFNPENRVYDFSCTRCGTTVRVFEEIISGMREAFREDGRLLEPLTKEEEEQQISDREASSVFFKEYGNNTSWKEREGFEKREIYRLDDIEAEKLR
jgi:hypothetical protein